MCTDVTAVPVSCTWPCKTASDLLLPVTASPCILKIYHVLYPEWEDYIAISLQRCLKVMAVPRGTTIRTLLTNYKCKRKATSCKLACQQS